MKTARTIIAKRWPAWVKIELAIALLLVAARCPAATSGQLLQPTPTQDSLIKLALTYVYQDSFEQAMTCAEQMRQTSSTYWPALVVKAAIVYMEMTDDEDYSRRDYFQALGDSATSGLEAHLASHPNDPWGHFFYGTALGYQSVWEGQHGSWLKAISRGLKAGKHFGHALRNQPDLYDAYLALGNLHYWRSAKIGFLRSLPFVPDQRRQGIEELKMAIAGSHYSSIAAALALGWIYFHMKDYASAAKLATDILQSGKVGRQGLWLRAMAYHAAGKWDEAVRDFATIRDGLVRKGNQNYYNLVVCGYYMGICHYSSGNYAQALACFDETLGYNLSDEVADRCAKKLRLVKEYRQKVLERLDDQATAQRRN